MSIRIRLTILITITTMVLVALSVWLGSRVMRQLATEAALDPILTELTLWLDFEQAEELPPGFDDGLPPIDDEPTSEGFEGERLDAEVVEVELAGLLRPAGPFDPSLPPEYLAALISEFGSDGLLYVSSLGLVAPPTPTTDLVWAADNQGTVSPTSQVPDEASIVPMLVLYHLVDYPALVPGIDPPGADSPQPEAVGLVFDRVVRGGHELGIAADAGAQLATIDEATNLLRVAGILAIALTGVAAWFITGRALAPVAAMTTEADQLSSTDLSQRLPGAGRPDEIGGLASTLNRMLTRLENSDRERRQFVSDASHELRTPLAVLANQAEVAQTTPESTSLDELAQVVEQESARMATLVADLLILARHDETSASVASRAASVFDLDDVVLEEAARSRRLPVDTAGVSAGQVRGDATTAARAVGHLLDNAARHGKTSVAVALWTDHSGVHLTVDDDGDGIAEADRDEVFKRFSRLDASRTRDQGGAGLGLAVVEATATSMGGTVQVAESPDGGARFVINLPGA